MNRIIILATFVLMLMTDNGFAQSKWSPGYVILPAGDTVYGFIDQRNSKSNSKLCYFKNEVNAKKTVYAPNELRGYKMQDGRYYVSKNLDGGESEGLCFLEFIIQGKINV